MDLHAECSAPNTPSAHARRGFARYMQLHKKRCIKRAGEAGVALRANPPDSKKKIKYYVDHIRMRFILF
ncbi:hypothetical protein C1N62_14930 [Nissabacter sp. SGAir0207]|nr:hypothetical protein C1N62_14930 [Nissabacter sp. SGAir0207]